MVWTSTAVLTWSENRWDRTQVKRGIPKGANVSGCSEAGGEVGGLGETGTVKLQSKSVDKEAGEKPPFQLHRCSGWAQTCPAASRSKAFTDSSRSSPRDIEASRQVRSFRVKEYLQDTRRHCTGESVQAEFAIYLCLLSICQIQTVSVLIRPSKFGI